MTLESMKTPIFYSGKTQVSEITIIEGALYDRPHRNSQITPFVSSKRLGTLLAPILAIEM